MGRKGNFGIKVEYLTVSEMIISNEMVTDFLKLN